MAFDLSLHCKPMSHKKNTRLKLVKGLDFLGANLQALFCCTGFYISFIQRRLFHSHALRACMHVRFCLFLCVLAPASSPTLSFDLIWS